MELWAKRRRGGDANRVSWVSGRVDINMPENEDAFGMLFPDRRETKGSPQLGSKHQGDDNENHKAGPVAFLRKPVG